MKSFYELSLLAEAMPPAPPAPPGGAAPGGMPPPGGDPSAAGGMPPGGDPSMGGMGGDPSMGGMGGGMGAQATPVPVRTIPAADVWKVLRRIGEDPQYQEFFDQINIARNPKPTKAPPSQGTPKTLMK